MGDIYIFAKNWVTYSVLVYGLKVTTNDWSSPSMTTGLQTLQKITNFKCWILCISRNLAILLNCILQIISLLKLFLKHLLSPIMVLTKPSVIDEKQTMSSGNFFLNMKIQLETHCQIYLYWYTHVSSFIKQMWKFNVIVGR